MPMTAATAAAQPFPSYPRSWYAASAVAHQRQPPLQGRKRADVVIIGAGFTGLSAALRLAERGYAVVVLEAERIGWGASGRNGGQVGSALRQPMSEIDLCYGETIANALWEISESGKESIRNLIAQQRIDCDWQSGNLLACTKPSAMPLIRKEAEFCEKRYGYQQYTLLDTALMRQWVDSDQYCGGLYDSGGGHLHPLNLALGLGQAVIGNGGQIYENTRAVSIDYGTTLRVGCHNGSSVEAKFLLLAVNAYLERLEPRIASSIMPIHNYILTTAALPEATAKRLIPSRCCVHSTNFVVDYYRLVGNNRLLFGGGEIYTMRYPKDLKAFVRRYLLKVFPQLASVPIDYAWGGKLAITSSRMPKVGYLQPNALYAHGYSGYGVALTQAVGKLVADAIAGSSERFDVLTKLRHRSFPLTNALRQPLLAVGMMYYALRDRLG